MAFNKKNYPPYWKQFSLYIRFERAENKCERCGAGNGFLKFISKDLPNGFEIIDPNDAGKIFEIESWLISCPVKVTKIVLTVAHLDHKTGVCRCRRQFGFKCAKPRHVRALCQSCHLNLDRPHHIAVRKKNAVKKKDSERGLFELV